MRTEGRQAVLALTLALWGLLSSEVAALQHAVHDATSAPSNATGHSTARQLQSFWEIPNFIRPFTSLTLLLDVCGRAPDYTPDAAQNLLTGSGRSFKNLYEQCSFGKTSVASNMNTVAKASIPIRGAMCNNVADVCGTNLQTVSDLAKAYARDVLGINVGQYGVVAIILPSGLPGTCGAMYGQAILRCFGGSSSYIWTTALNLPLLAHEFGHTMGLGHATLGSDDYGDYTSPMSGGNAQSSTCFNAFQADKLGWSTPVAQIAVNTMATNTWTRVTLPCRAATSRNFLRVTDGGAGALGRNTFWISYVAPVGWESNLPASLTKKALVHAQHVSDVTKSDFLATLSAGQQWALKSGYPKLVIRLASTASGSDGMVLLCRATSSSQCTTASGSAAEGGSAQSESIVSPSPSPCPPPPVVQVSSPPPRRSPPPLRRSPPPLRRSPPPLRRSPPPLRRSPPPKSRSPSPATRTRTPGPPRPV